MELTCMRACLVAIGLNLFVFLGVSFWYLSIPPPTLDPRFLVVDPDNYSADDFPVIRPPLPDPPQELVYTQCPDVQCEYWNFVGEFFSDPQKFYTTAHSFRYLYLPPNFQTTLPVVLTRSKRSSAFSTYFNDAAKFINQPIFSHIPKRSSCSTTVYYGATADFLRAYALWPNTQKMIFLSHEDISLAMPFPLTRFGNLESLTIRQEGIVRKLGDSVQQYMELVALGQDVEEFSFGEMGVLPYLLAQLHVTGHHILSVTHDENEYPEKVEIRYSSPVNSLERVLIFVPSLGHLPADEHLLEGLIGTEPHVLLVQDRTACLERCWEEVRAAEGHPFCKERVNSPEDIASFTRSVHWMNMLTNRAAVVIQDEWGIPHYWFEDEEMSPLQGQSAPSKWETQLFGAPFPGLVDDTTPQRLLVSLSNESTRPDSNFYLRRFRSHLQCSPVSALPHKFWYSENRVCRDQDCDCVIPEASCEVYVNAKYRLSQVFVAVRHK